METIEQKIQSLLQYRNALREGDQEIFDRLVSYAQGHVNACARANDLSVLETMLLAVVIEQQKKIDQLVTL